MGSRASFGLLDTGVDFENNAVAQLHRQLVAEAK